MSALLNFISNSLLLDQIAVSNDAGHTSLTTITETTTTDACVLATQCAKSPFALLSSLYRQQPNAAPENTANGSDRLSRNTSEASSPRVTRFQTLQSPRSCSLPNGMMLRTKKRSRDEILSLVDAEAGLQPQKKKRKLNSASRSSSAAYSKSDSTVLYEAVDIPGRSRAPYADKVLHKILRQLPERDSERPWYADVLHKVPGAIDIVERKNLSQAQKSDFLFYVEISFAKGRTQEYYLKIFGDYEAGWAEATLPQTMAEKVANSADRKLIPEVHGACIRRLGNKKVDPQLGYFALMLPSGLTLKLLQREKVNLAWPLQWFCQEIFKMLLEFCLLDPYSSDYHFYHGDTNQNNYLIDTEKKRFVMIDFGRSYFAWPGRPNPFVLTARRDGLPPKQSTKDVATFYSVVAQLISLPNSSKTPENWNTWLSLLKFVSRKHLVTSTEPQNFQKWCSDHGIKIS